MRFFSVLLLLLHACSLLESRAPAPGDLAWFSQPGNVTIGGLFPIHQQAIRSSEPSLFDAASCTDFDVMAVLAAQVMLYSIEQINNSTMLPNISLGYEIHDTCSDASMAIRATLGFMQDENEPADVCSASIPCHFSTVEPRVKAVIGEDSSEMSTVVARLLAMPMITQISYASTSKELSDKSKYPSFLRTVSSDVHQTMAIVQLIETLGFYSIAVIGSDDEYSKNGIESILDDLDDHNLCLAVKKILPSSFSRNNSQTQEMLTAVMDTIKNSTAEAIVLFTSNLNAELILEEAVKQDLRRTWIASDTWSSSTTIVSMDGIQKVGRVFGFSWKTKKIPGFEEHMRSIQEKAKKNSSYWGPFLACPSTSAESKLWNCSFKVKRGEAEDDAGDDSGTDTHTCMDLGCFVHHVQMFSGYHYAVYLAVNAVAHGLRSLLQCDDVGCEQNTDFYPWELHKEVKEVNFTLNDINLAFDENGDPSVGYNLLSWNTSNPETPFEIIGEYNLDGNITLPQSLVNEFTSITSILGCDRRCSPGYGLVETSQSCCKKCTICSVNQFSEDGKQCGSCEDNMISSANRSSCVPLKEQYLEWGDPVAIVLSVFSALGILFLLSIAALLVKSCNTPMMKCAGGQSSFIILVSLCACFCSVYTFIGRPTWLSCRVGLPLFSTCFTLSVSCIVANLFQIFVGFVFDAELSARVRRFNRPVAIVMVCTGVQGLLCLLWLVLSPPSMREDGSNEVVKLTCTLGSDIIFGIQLAYTAFLCIICFLFAFKGKHLPDLYKNASCVTISMLIYLVVWVLFLPTYMRFTQSNTQAIEATAILVTTISLLCSHFCPKCYIILFKKEINDEKAILERIRKHFENKGIPPVTSAGR